MKRIFFVLVVGSAMAVNSPIVLAREVVVLPGVVSPVGVATGVDTQGPGTLSVGNQDINTGNDAGGAITTDAADTATIVFSGNSVANGFVGQVGSTFLNITAGANGNTVTFTGPVFSTTFTVSGTGTINFNSDFTSNTGSTMDFAGDGFINVGPGQTVTAAITNTAGANTGTLTLFGNSILNGAVGAASGLKQINVVGGNALITGQANAANYTLGTNTLNVAGAFAIPVAGTINTTIFSPVSYGKIIPVGAATIGNALQINVTVTGPITSGTDFDIVDATSGTTGSTVTATSNTTRYTFSALPSTAGLVRITATQIPLADVVAPVINPAAPVVASVIDALPVTPDTLPVITAITLLPTAEAVADALAQLAPGAANMAAPRTAFQVTQRFQSLLFSRLEAQAACNQNSQSDDRKKVWLEDASACQPDDTRAHLWATASGYFGEQGNVDGYEGYDSRILGLMVAIDKPLSETTHAGLALTYARSEIDGKIYDGDGDINSYQATAFFGYVPGPWFVNGALTYGFDDYSGSRRIAFPGFDATAEADYSGQQFTAYGAAGYNLYVGDGATVVTPTVSLQYTRMQVNAYTEEGAGAVNLRISDQDYDFLRSGLGAKVSRDIPLSGTGILRPEIHANWWHSFGDETMENTAAFTGGGPDFTISGLKPRRETYQVGTGVTFANIGPWSVEGVYDYQWQGNKYSAQQAMITFAMRL